MSELLHLYQLLGKCQRKCNGHPEKRIDGACQSKREDMVIYIHTMVATQLPVLLPVGCDIAVDKKYLAI
jgi:hypothetical protein